jgi:hypothetical protein
MERDSLSILVFETVEHIELPPIAESVKGPSADELTLESVEYGHPVLCQTNLVFETVTSRSHWLDIIFLYVPYHANADIACSKRR